MGVIGTHDGPVDAPLGSRGRGDTHEERETFLARTCGAPLVRPEVLAACLSSGHVPPGADGFRWPLLVEGEAGTGKLHVLETMCDRARCGGRPAVLDAALAPVDGAGGFLRRLRAALAGDGVVVLRHVELLPAAAARAAAALLDERLEAGLAGAGGRRETARVAGTLTHGWPRSDVGVQALIHRLGTVRVVVPPLRERRQEVPGLVEVTMRSAGLARPWSAAALAALQGGDWPGNVRQLRNVVLAAGSAPTADPVTVDELPAELAPGPTRRQLSRIEAIERAAIIADLRAADGNKREAARRLGVSRSTLYRKLRAYEVG